MPPTRRDFLATSALAALGVAAGRPLAAVAQQAAQPGVQHVFTPIRRNVGMFTMRGGTVGGDERVSASISGAATRAAMR